MPLGSQFTLGNNWHISVIANYQDEGWQTLSEPSHSTAFLTILENTGKGLYRIALLISLKA